MLKFKRMILQIKFGLNLRRTKEKGMKMYVKNKKNGKFSNFDM